MTTPDQNQSQTQENKPSDKELNFRKQEQMYQKKMAEMEAQIQEMNRRLQENKKSDDEDSDDEPYVDHKKLEKKLNKFGQSTQNEIQKAMELAKSKAKEELKQELWMEKNPDFYEVLRHADKFAEQNPELAETILAMPEGFDRQKLVYKNIKALGIDKPQQKEPSIQDKINANRKSPYYQPSGVGTAPYSTGGDFSPAGQKAAYDKLRELKSRLGV